MAHRKLTTTKETIRLPFGDDLSTVQYRFKSKPPKDLDKIRRVVICPTCNIAMCYTSLSSHRKSKIHQNNQNLQQTELN